MTNNDNFHSLDTGSFETELRSVSAAFEACLEPRTANDVRRQALEHLEQVTSKAESPQYGLLLAGDSTRSQALRYFGLQLIEYAVRYRFDTFNDDRVQQTLTWITGLATDCTDQDPSFFRNKIAQLWVECAERAWPEQWQKMDTELGRLWTQPSQLGQMSSKLLVLDILESMSADICGEDNNLVALRIEDLGSALNEIVVPENFYKEKIKDRSGHRSSGVRWSNEGWLLRLSMFVVECVRQSDSSQVRTCLLRALAAMKSIIYWVDLQAVLETDSCAAIGFVLQHNDFDVQLSVVEALHAIISKMHGDASQQPTILRFVLDTEQVSKLSFIFQQRYLEAENVYQLQKKTSELVAAVMHAIVEHPDTAMNSTGLHEFFDLLPRILQHDSLIVSIPVLHSWTKLLASKDSRLQDNASNALGILMETCAQRLVNFELLGEDFDHPIITLLYQDFDTMPERHAFLANYRRYCISVIEMVVRRRPMEAAEHVIAQIRSLLSTGPYMRERGLAYTSYSKAALAVQQMEAQITVALTVVSCLLKWKAHDLESAQIQKKEQLLSPKEWIDVTTSLNSFCIDMCGSHLDDPEAEAGLVTLLSSIVRNCDGLDEAVVRLTRYILDAHIATEGANDNFQSSARNYEVSRGVELQKVALVRADVLLGIYDELESKIGMLCKAHSPNHKVVCGYHAFLFIISHRTSNLSSDVRWLRLQQILQPLTSAWANPMMTHAVSSFDTFCESLGLDELTTFYREHGFAKVEDWASQQLNEQGQAKLILIKDRLESLPLRMTRALLGATTEKLKAGTNEHDMACSLWAPLIPITLPPLLQMIGQAQAFSNLSNWSYLSDDMQAVVRRTLQDRFWQSGISSESRDEFYARVSGSKSSYEGFASNVRGTIRGVREQGYQILFLFTKFEEQFYGMNDLPEPLSNALFNDADALSANHLNPLISLMTGLAQGCPPQYRARFLPPLLRKMFAKLDIKIGRDWESIIRVNEQSGEEDDLSEEMRIESVLRQVTYATVSFVAFLLEPIRSNDPKHRRVRPTLMDVVLSDNTVLEPLILFCTHALRMRDTRCCTTICKILIHIIPTFTADTEQASQVRDFICTAVLKACITSLNEQYFVDMQRDLASLLVQIIILYSPKTSTPRSVLLSLPDMQAEKVDRTFDKLLKPQNSRQQRALVLNLLESVRSVSIHDMGKISRSSVKKENKNGVPAQYMEIEQHPVITAGDEAALEGVADLFGSA